MGQRAAGEEGDIAVVVFFHRLAHGPAEAGAVVEVVGGAQRRDRDDLEVLVDVHVAHGHQGAVFRAQGGGIVGHGLYAEAVAFLGQQAAQFGVAGELVLHVADEVRQLVAGVQALEVRAAVDVVVGVDQPVGVEHHDGVHVQFAAAAADFYVPVDGGLAEALARAGQFGQVHGGDVGDLGSQSEFAHGRSPSGRPAFRAFKVIVIVCARSAIGILRPFLEGGKGRRAVTAPSAGCGGCPWKCTRS
ncbi:hypothetical protein D9M69_554990 [compost metagenome]